MTRRFLVTMILAAALPLAAACGAPAGPPAGPPPVTTAARGSALAEVHDPAQVTGVLTGSCRYSDAGQLPDPRCTPGSVDPAVTQRDIRQTICVPGYTATVRPPETQTEQFKYGDAYRAYGVPDSRPTELDHLVPLELAGSNDAANLWPEWPPTPNPKDKVENALNAAVCDGRVSLAAAQQAIASNWTTAESSLRIG